MNPIERSERHSCRAFIPGIQALGAEKKEIVILRAILLILIFGLQYSIVIAQNDNSNSIITGRIQFIENTLDHTRVNTQRWWYGWLAGYSAATIAQGAVYFTGNDKTTRQDMALGAATTLLGAAGQFFSPFNPHENTRQFHSMPAYTRDEQLKKLEIAEDLLKECAIREKSARKWQNHILPGAANLGSGLITWLGFKRTVWAGIGNFALNTVVTETQIWTQPTLAKRKYKEYCRKFITGDQPVSYTPEINWYMEAFLGGIGIKVEF